MKINSDRLLRNLQLLREYTDTPGDGVTRFSYGTQDARARAFLLDRARTAGASVYTDILGNVRLGLKSNRPDRQTILCGSHVDTVRNGGWLDGIYGVCSAIEVLETLSEHDYTGPYNYEAVIFAEEEGSNFGSTMTGSKFVTGIYTDDDLDHLVRDDGMSLRQVLCRWPDGNAEVREPDVSHVIWDFSRVRAMLELHIEQGPVLDQAGISLGIVQAVFGMRVIEVTLHGVGNHAGATPMALRSDALCTASECILAAEEIVRGDADRRIVATVGKLDVSPNCSNVIPEKVKFSLEIRDKDEVKIDRFMDTVIAKIQDIATARGVACEIREHSRSTPLTLDAEITGIIEAAASESGNSYLKIDSGAVHDAAMIAQLAPAGMIFVPSINGRSHVPEEDTHETDLIAGAQLLLDTVLRID